MQLMNLRTIATGAVLALTVAACAGSAAAPLPGSSAATSSAAPTTSSAAPLASSAATGSNPTPITVKDFSLDPNALTVAGQASLGVTNAGPTIHNVSIRDASGTVVAATKDLRTNQSEVLTFDIPAGTYTLFCSLPGHESLGIKGTLTVTK